MKPTLSKTASKGVDFERRDVSFKSQGLKCAGWYYVPKGLMSDKKRPAIVMAHGYSAVKEMYLDKFAEKFVEVVAAPSYEEGVVEMLARQKSMRIIEMPRLEHLKEYRDLRYLSFMSLQDGGIMLQQSFINEIREPADFMPAAVKYKGKEYTTLREPDKQEYLDLIFGWSVLQGVTSNSVVFVKDGSTIAVGGGEQDRVGVAQHAVNKAYIKYADLLCFNRYSMPYNLLRLEVDQGKRPPEILDVIMEEASEVKGGLIGSCMVSDAFFPFRDGVDVGIREGITAVAHPGGSVRDHEVIEAVNEQDPPVAMVYTGQRCFRH